MQQFKVGDRVVVSDRLPQSSFYPNGARGTVVEVDSDGDCWVKFDAICRVYVGENGRRTWCAIPERLDHENPRPTLLSRLRSLFGARS